MPYLLTDDTLTVFSNYGVLSQRELESRYEVSLEQYVTKLNIESETASSIARTMLLPAAVRHLAMLRGGGVSSLATEAEEMVNEFIEAINGLEDVNLDENHPDGDILEEAKYMHDTVLASMDAVRASADKLEKIVADDLWPLPKYSEILFIK
jgi:glutamine synthetase